ncbi:hypothetical protein [Kutzneria kofuensis]|uniref:Uncharacterized protein n=1 Tax=Kutzneria kofuensis TaxID=103725 RepID=A0A7W9KBV5_9PSEU|nr:hypothetical protein [Kutzneria kofuensis]MBB5889753.1 hypothetical protein [Kutzneria kofuensis]
MFIVFFVRALNDPALSEAFRGDDTDELAAFFTGLDRQSQADGTSPPWPHPEREVATLMAVSAATNVRFGRTPSGFTRLLSIRTTRLHHSGRPDWHL